MGPQGEIMGDNNSIPTLDFPLRNEWKAINNPGDPRYAFDFCATGYSQRQLFATSFVKVLLGRAPVSDSCTWSKPVYSPFEGGVIQASDG